jgi:hypothetical protein
VNFCAVSVFVASAVPLVFQGGAGVVAKNKKPAIEHNEAGKIELIFKNIKLIIFFRYYSFVFSNSAF